MAVLVALLALVVAVVLGFVAPAVLVSWAVGLGFVQALALVLAVKLAVGGK